MSENAPLVIIGTGLAGYNLAREWRKLDAQSPLLLITADDGRSYSKPMLSTGFSKNKDADGLAMAEPGAMAEQLKARILTHTRVTGIDPGHKRIWIGEEQVEYRDLVLAWGAETIRVPVQGDALDAIFPINDLEDYARFRAAAAGKRRVLLLGAGLIGCEFANDLSAGGYQVDVVAPCEQVMPGLLHPAAAAAVQAGLEGLGVRFHLGPVLNRLERAGESLEAHLSDGQAIPCDLVVSAVGLRPRIDLAAEAGLEVNRGVVVNRELRTSHANIYALGDCAEVDGLNLLYVMPLMSCARALAQTLAGKPTAVSYGPMPVTVKTPVCPLVVSPPPRGSDGQWLVEGSGADLKVLCRDTAGRLLGYALTGAAVSEKLSLNKELPALLA
ncbi:MULTISPECIES: NAD(P)/FAD-dependent oxidoreductase [unclassified Pseudomonas]|uniref:NAD(P)/FAD-dependent oxidoreductase n=1 Tax=unclassified Pseudomonas TaxID=196821 RepID=UPI0002A1B839|nr:MULTISPECIES: FAD-dependent oxidoreductase [unclassified Pseudomonas]MBB1605254.1 pyridine nucleotide-disulfide oxidoreductase [Pseudomonas sp. UMC76]MBB1637399.1 pyridine nucleotide-disulfide oxidoreductase [Pseudomonas sp. UME83]NTX90623.1 FAD-dependent oxidoreductase [Pseudomonas sp. UMA643]NTY20041.1 FAD-dependent oxidoreductase [Pseudomonas sp. UMC3103]NTY24261.1 FAD-dependent oxidoreductase [Pseudomonas sp. UMA603]